METARRGGGACATMSARELFPKCSLTERNVKRPTAALPPNRCDFGSSRGLEAHLGEGQGREGVSLGETLKTR